MTISSMNQSFMLNSMMGRSSCSARRPKLIAKQCCCHSFGYAHQNIVKLNSIMDKKIRESVKYQKDLNEYQQTSNEF